MIGTEPALDITVVAHDVGPIGGMERQLTELVVGLLQAGHHVTVISRRCDLASHPSLRWIRVPGPARPFPLAYPWFFIVGTWLVRRHRAGILQTTGAIVCNRADVCAIHFCHHGARGKVELEAGGRNVFYRANRRVSAALARLGERLMYRSSMVRQFVAVSEGVAQEMREHFPDSAAEIAVIGNAVDHSVFGPDPAARTSIRAAYGLSESELLVLFVGGDWEWKGLHLAIDAVAALPDCHLLVVGSGDIERYRKLARERRCEARVHFTGARRDPARFYASADVFLLPSVYETFSLVTFEAAATGLPLVATRVSGVEDVLRDGQNGWFIPREADAIRARLGTLAADKTLRAAMGLRSRQAVSRYSWSRMVLDYASLYRRLVDPPNGTDRVQVQSLAGAGR